MKASKAQGGDIDVDVNFTAKEGDIVDLEEPAWLSAGEEQEPQGLTEEGARDQKYLGSISGGKGQR